MVILEWIGNWFKGVLIDGVMWNLTTQFTDVNNQIGEVAAQVGTSPAAWNPGIFSLIRNLSETIILPIAGIILTFVMCYELIQMIIEKNNLHDLDTWMFFRWVFKTFVAVVILANTFNIVMAVFDVSQSVIQDASGLIGGATDVSPDMLTEIEASLQGMSIGPLIGLWLLSLIVKLTVFILNIVIFIIAYARMLEIYLLTSLAPIPFATVGNKEISHIGQNYFKSLLAIAFQGFLIMVCMAIYAVLVQNIATSVIGGDPFGAIGAVLGYTILLCFMLVKTGALSKAVFNAH